MHEKAKILGWDLDTKDSLAIAKNTSVPTAAGS